MRLSCSQFTKSLESDMEALKAEHTLAVEALHAAREALKQAEDNLATVNNKVFKQLFGVYIGGRVVVGNNRYVVTRLSVLQQHFGSKSKPIIYGCKITKAGIPSKVEQFIGSHYQVVE